MPGPEVHRAMAMNVQSIPGVSDRINEIRLLTAEIINKEILPVENQLWAVRQGTATHEADRQRARDLRAVIQAKVKQAGLWAPHLPEEYGGCGLSFLEHAYMNEVLAYCMGAASLFGVVARNSGNRKILL
jgi:acyl-CoA dehydrogenase